MFKRMKHSTKILPTLVATGTMLTSPVMAQGDEQRDFLESRAKEIKSAQEAPKSSLDTIATLGDANGPYCKDYVKSYTDTFELVNVNNPDDKVKFTSARCIPETTNPDGTKERLSDRVFSTIEANGVSREAILNFGPLNSYVNMDAYKENRNGMFRIEYDGPIPEANIGTPAASEVNSTTKTNSDVDEVIPLSGGKDSEGLVVEGQRNYMILPVFGERGARVTLQDDGNYLVEPIKTIAGVNMNGEMEYSFYSGAQTWNKKQLDFSLGYRFFHAENKTIANSTSMGEKEFNHMENLDIALCNDKIKHGCFTENEAAQIGGIVASIEITNDAINNGLYNPEEHFERGTMTEYAKTNWGYVMPAKYYESMSDKDGVYSTETQKILAKRLEDMCFDQGTVTFNDAYNCGYDIVSKGVTYGGDK